MNEKRFACDYMIPKKGKFFYFFITSALGLFIVTMLFLIEDYDFSFSISNLLSILFYCFIFSLAAWSIAYGIKYLKTKLKN